jgi:hypothetical protein
VATLRRIYCHGTRHVVLFTATHHAHCHGLRLNTHIILYRQSYCQPGKISSRDCVTIHEVYIGNQIYWALIRPTRDYNLQITIKHKLVFSVTVFTALLGIGFQRRTSHFLRVPCLRPQPQQLSTVCLPADSISTPVLTWTGW